MRCTIPFQLCVVAYNMLGTLMQDVRPNIITKNKKKMTSLMNCRSSNELHFPKVKALSKHLKMTINDIVMCGLSIGLRKVFLEHDDQNKLIQMCVPANIRFGFPPSREAAKVENKITVVPLALPLCDTFDEAYDKIPKVSKLLKNNFFQIYATYALTLWTNSMFPSFIPR